MLVSVRVRDIPDDCNPTPIMDSDEAIPTDEREIEEMFGLNLTEENLVYNLSLIYDIRKTIHMKVIY